MIRFPRAFKLRSTFAGLSKQNRFAFVFRLGNVKRAATRSRKIGEHAAILELGGSLL